MATIAEQLTSLNTNLNTINTEVGNQETLIAQIKEKVENLPEAGGNTPLLNIISGTVTSNEYGEITFPMPTFEPKQIMVWNVREVDFDDYVGHDGVMLCAVKLETGHWIAHYMAQESGSYFIAQASAERGPFENDVQGYSWTNIYETSDSLIWRLGKTSYEDQVTDFTDIILNYVLIG